MPFRRSARALSLLAALTLVALVSGAPAAAQTRPSADPVRALEAGLLPANVPRGTALPRWSLAERMEVYHVPGVSVAVVEGGRLVWAHAWGVRRAGGTAPVDTATLFQAASISKPVAALAALSLVQQDRLSLDADVNGYLRTWTLPDAEATRTEKVTLRRLLSHTAGLTVHGFRGYASSEDVPTTVQVLDGDGPANSAPIRADLVPGSQWRYSGGGTTVAQLMMADVTGMSFDAFMRTTVLEPLGLRNSTYTQPLPSGRAANAASGHRSDGSVVEGEWHTYPEQAAAGLWTTPSDLARIAIEVQRAWHGESDRIITQATAREMLTVVDGSYGLGFGIGDQEGEPTFSHGGANEGFRATFFAFRDGGRGAVIMTNGDGGSGLASEILRGIAHLNGWPGPVPTTRAVRTVSAEERTGLTGTFALDRTVVTVETAGAGANLRVSLPDGTTREFFPAADGRWFSLGGGPELEFRMENGRAAAIAVHNVSPQPITLRRRTP